MLVFSFVDRLCLRIQKSEVWIWPFVANSLLLYVKFFIQIINRSESPPHFVSFNFFDCRVVHFQFVVFGLVELAVMDVEAKISWKNLFKVLRLLPVKYFFSFHYFIITSYFKNVKTKFKDAARSCSSYNKIERFRVWCSRSSQ